MGRRRAIQSSKIDKWHDCLYAMAGMRIMGEDDWEKYSYLADLPPVNPCRGEQANPILFAVCCTIGTENCESGAKRSGKAI